MKKELSDFLNKLAPDFDSIKLQATKYFDIDSFIRDDGAAFIYKRSWIAPQNFGLVLFAPAKSILFESLQEETKITIPKLYKVILLQMNGCFIYDFQLFGLLESNSLNRTTLQPLSVKTANTNWINAYNVNNNFFHIGSRSLSYDENIGYFIAEDKIFAIRENGEILNSWTSFSEFLNNEIPIVEEMMLEEKADREN